MSVAERTAQLGPEFRTNPLAMEALEAALAQETQFENPPQITLELITCTADGQPIDPVSVGATGAYQCYSSGTPAIRERDDPKAVETARSTLESGHLTTRMFYHMTWRLEGVSRSGIHDVLHYTPFHNSNQRSQRYVEGKPGEYLVPAGLTAEQRQIFIESANFANESYGTLLQLLEPAVGHRVREMYPASWQKSEAMQARMDEKTRKICQEVARYVMPIGQRTTMLHDLNEVQLLRMFENIRRMPQEAQYVVAQMIMTVAKHHPQILAELPEPLPPLDQGPLDPEQVAEATHEFDADLEQAGNRWSRLVSHAEHVRAEFVATARRMLRVPRRSMSDADVLKVLLDPQVNQELSSMLDSGMLGNSSALRQVTFRFITRLSHAADSQRQRHRRTPGATPSIDMQYNGEADYITPLVIREDSELSRLYDEIMLQIYANVERALAAGISREQALLLLPNAHALRIEETGDLFDWAHRLRQRLCALAQEEIFFVSLEQAQQIIAVLPEAVHLLQAPCGVAQRAGRGACTEGHRFCGRLFWKLALDQYAQNRLI